MFVRNIFKKITQEIHYAKTSSKKLLTSSVGINKNYQVCIREEKIPNRGGVINMLSIVGAQLN